MFLKTAVITPFQQNARLLINEDENSAVIIDPGGEIDYLWEIWELEGFSRISVLLTHSHIDHVGGLGALVEKLSDHRMDLSGYWGHEMEQEWRESVPSQAAFFGLPRNEFKDISEPYEYLAGGETLEFGSVSAEVLFTPGHSPGHLSFFFSNQRWQEEWVFRDGETDYFEGEGPVLIAGDALFRGSIGRTDLPGGDHDTLLQSINEKLLPLPDDTVVLSGHGPNTTIGQEKETNPFLQEDA